MSDVQALVESIVRMSPPVALIFGLNAMMYFLRRTPRIPKWTVPWITMLLGSLIYPLITHRAEMIFHVPYPVVAQAMTGFLIGFAAIGSHRLFEQTMWRFGYEKDGKQESKESDLKQRPSRSNNPHDVGL